MCQGKLLVVEVNVLIEVDLVVGSKCLYECGERYLINAIGQSVHRLVHLGFQVAITPVLPEGVREGTIGGVANPQDLAIVAGSGLIALVLAVGSERPSPLCATALVEGRIDEV